MIADRLRECLTVLRWSDEDLADELGAPCAQVRAWLNGRSHAPIVVAAWLETLVKAYRTTPHPRTDPQGRLVCTEPAGSAREIRVPRQHSGSVSAANGAGLFQASNQQVAAGADRGMPVVPPQAANGGNRESHAL